MGEAYTNLIIESGTPLLIPQKVSPGFKHSFWTFASIFEGEKYGIKWQDFRKKYIEFGGDGIYAAWQTINNEPAFKNNDIGWGEVSVSEPLQKKIMQFTTNQKDESDRKTQIKALEKTLLFFDKGTN